MRMNKNAFFLLILIVPVGVTTLAALGRGIFNDGPQNKQRNPGKDDFESQFPVADYQPRATSSESREKREARNRRFKGEPGDINENSEVILSTRHWAEGLSGLPVGQSQAIIVGQVSDSKAFLTDDKSGVYSEFTINVDHVLKDNSSSPLSPNSSVTVEREGGRIRFSSGRVALSYTSGMGMPRIGRRYVLFLTHAFPFGEVQNEDYYLLTGYELRGGRVVPIDNPGGGTHPIAKYKDMDEEAFLSRVRAAIADSHPATAN